MNEKPMVVRTLVFEGEAAEFANKLNDHSDTHQLPTRPLTEDEQGDLYIIVDAFSKDEVFCSYIRACTEMYSTCYLRKRIPALIAHLLTFTREAL